MIVVLVKGTIHMIYAEDDVYAQIARLLPTDRPIQLLDLGCCTGLDYDVFRHLNPETEVTGINDEESLNMLLKKKAGKRIEHLRLIYGDYFNIDLGSRHYDAAISVMELHEYNRKNKLSLYRKIYNALEREGIYIEQDYIKEENVIFGSLNNMFSTQISLLLESGFQRVEKAWHHDNTIVLKAIK